MSCSTYPGVPGIRVEMTLPGSNAGMSFAADAPSIPEAFINIMRGPQGPAGGTETSALAGVALGGHRAVLLNAVGEAIYADRTIAAHVGRLCGVTKGAAIQGAEVFITQAGLMIEPSWSWTPDAPVFLGMTGLLTQVVPTTGFLQVIGVAVSAISLFVNPREPLAL